jgi:hypothetical protein
MNLLPLYLLVTDQRLTVNGHALIITPAFSIHPADGLTRLLSAPVLGAMRPDIEPIAVELEPVHPVVIGTLRPDMRLELDLRDETVELGDLVLVPDFDAGGQAHQPGTSGPVHIQWSERPRSIRLG